MPGTPVAAVSLVIWRAQGAVVVTLRTDLDRRNSELLERVLADLIEGQGNLVVVVDMRDTRLVGPEAFGVLRSASEQARRRGGTFGVTRLSPDARRALGQAGLDHVIEAVSTMDILPPRSGKGG